MDDPANRRLLHCKPPAPHRRAGGRLRMEYDGWDPLAAVEGTQSQRFGDVACTAANDYVQQMCLITAHGSEAVIVEW